MAYSFSSYTRGLKEHKCCAELPNEKGYVCQCHQCDAGMCACSLESQLHARLHPEHCGQWVGMWESPEEGWKDAQGAAVPLP